MTNPDVLQARMAGILDEIFRPPPPADQEKGKEHKDGEPDDTVGRDMLELDVRALVRKWRERVDYARTSVSLDDVLASEGGKWAQGAHKEFIDAFRRIQAAESGSETGGDDHDDDDADKFSTTKWSAPVDSAGSGGRPAWKAADRALAVYKGPKPAEFVSRVIAIGQVGFVAQTIRFDDFDTVQLRNYADPRQVTLPRVVSGTLVPDTFTRAQGSEAVFLSDANVDRSQEEILADRKLAQLSPLTFRAIAENERGGSFDIPFTTRTESRVRVLFRGVPVGRIHRKSEGRAISLAYQIATYYVDVISSEEHGGDYQLTAEQRLPLLVPGARELRPFRFVTSMTSTKADGDNAHFRAELKPTYLETGPGSSGPALDVAYTVWPRSAAGKDQGGAQNGTCTFDFHLGRRKPRLG